MNLDNFILSIFAFLVFSLLFFVIFANLRTFYQKKKNPHLVTSFLNHLAFKGDEKAIFLINDRLKLELEYDFVCDYRVFAKDSNNVWIQVEQKSNYPMKSSYVVSFDEPWKSEIENFLKNKYDSDLYEKERIKQEKEQHIQSLKENW